MITNIINYLYLMFQYLYYYYGKYFFFSSNFFKELNKSSKLHKKITNKNVIDKYKDL